MQLTTNNRFCGRIIRIILVACSIAIALSAQIVYTDGGGLISMEAEHGAVINRAGVSWNLSTASYNFSGTGYLMPSPNNGTIWDPTYAGVAPEVQFEVDFKTTGTYAVWLRGAGVSVHVGLDGAPVGDRFRNRQLRHELDMVEPAHERHQRDSHGGYRRRSHHQRLDARHNLLV